MQGVHLHFIQQFHPGHGDAGLHDGDDGFDRVTQGGNADRWPTTLPRRMPCRRNWISVMTPRVPSEPT